MAKYTNEYSKLPLQIMELHNYKDVNDSIAEVVNEIKELQSKGLYNQATRVIENNKDVLGKYIFSTESFNAIEEETRNLEIMCKEKKQSIYFEQEPDNPEKNDIWIS